MDPIVKEMLRGYVQSITFESNVNEPITVLDPFGDKPPDLSDTAMAALKPKFTVGIKDFGPTVVAPYGEPSRGAQDAVKIGGAVVGGIAVIGLLAWLANRKG